MKYIMFEVTSGTITKKLPIVFPDDLIHQWVARSLLPMLRMQYDNAKPISAGSFNMLSGETFGDSETLKLKADKEDGDIIGSYDYLHGM